MKNYEQAWRQLVAQNIHIADLLAYALAHDAKAMIDSGFLAPGDAAAHLLEAAENERQNLVENAAEFLEKMTKES